MLSLRGGNNNPTGKNQYTNMPRRYKRCEEELCDVIWEDKEPHWKRSINKGMSAYICVQCKEFLMEEEDE